MKVGDLVMYKPEYLGFCSTAVIVGVGYSGELTHIDESCALHPDIWVLVNGYKERWNERYVEVISESR